MQELADLKKLEEAVDLSDAIGLAAAAALMRGRGGKAPCVDTLRRWANPKHGCRPAGPEGPRIVLRTVRVSNDLLTLPGWVEEFERQRVLLGARGEGPPPDQRPARSRAASHRRACRRLEDGGVGGKN